jgi:type I restriction enzyme S subunit
MRARPHVSYKPSSETWVGEIPVSWNEVRAKQLFAQRRERANSCDPQLAATQAYGVIPQAEFMEREGQRVVLALSGTSNFSRVHVDDFVISLRSFQGGIEHSAYSGCVTPAYTVLRPSGDVHVPFFRWLLKSAGFVSALNATTEGIREGKTVPYGSFGEIRLPVPPLEEQRSIAAFLDHETAQIDELVQEQERLLRLLEERDVARISELVTRGLNAGAEFRDSGREEIGTIPAHWAVVSLKHLQRAPLAYGANEAAVEDDPALPRYIRITDVDEQGKLRGETFKSLPWDVARPYLLEDGDILLARSGATVGKSFLYRKDIGPACFAGYMIRARFDSRKLLPEFAQAFFRSRAYWDYIQGFNIQATIQNVSAEKYGNCPVPVPPMDVQVQIVERVTKNLQASWKLVIEAKQSIEYLTERRSALINAAVTGQIDLRNWRPHEPQKAAEVA